MYFWKSLLLPTQSRITVVFNKIQMSFYYFLGLFTVWTKVLFLKKIPKFMYFRFSVTFNRKVPSHCDQDVYSSLENEDITV